MDVLSTPEMLAREKAAFASGITAAALMEAAGQSMAGRIAAIYPAMRNFLVLVGKGNNGGDGLVVARHLAKPENCVEVVLTAPEIELGELPQAQLARLRKECPEVDIAPWSDAILFPYSDGVVIDALLGIQAKGALRGIVAEVVAKLNTERTANFFRTVALDLPSGLAAYEEGPAPADKNAAVIADITIAVGFAKTVLVRESLSPTKATSANSPSSRAVPASPEPPCSARRPHSPPASASSPSSRTPNPPPSSPPTLRPKRWSPAGTISTQPQK
jgi:NAD(P)H-hydrate epimerase